MLIKIPNHSGLLGNNLHPGYVPKGSLLSFIILQELEQFLDTGN